METIYIDPNAPTIYHTPEKTYNIIPMDTEDGQGGISTPTLQSKIVTITENGTQTINPDYGYDGLSSVQVTTTVNQQTITPSNEKIIGFSYVFDRSLFAFNVLFDKMTIGPANVTDNDLQTYYYACIFELYKIHDYFLEMRCRMEYRQGKHNVNSNAIAHMIFYESTFNPFVERAVVCKILENKSLIDTQGIYYTKNNNIDIAISPLEIQHYNFGNTLQPYITSGIATPSALSWKGFRIPFTYESSVSNIIPAKSYAIVKTSQSNFYYLLINPLTTTYTVNHLYEVVKNFTTTSSTLNPSDGGGQLSISYTETSSSTFRLRPYAQRDYTNDIWLIKLPEWLIPYMNLN